MSRRRRRRAERSYEYDDGSYHRNPEEGVAYYGYDASYSGNHEHMQMDQTSFNTSVAPMTPLVGDPNFSDYNTPSTPTPTPSYSDDSEPSYSYNSSYTYQVAHTKTYTTQDTYMRQRTVNFTASGLTPQATGFYLTFNGGTVSGVTPASGFSQDSSGNGTFKTDSKGWFSGSFEVPADVPTGVREVAFKNGKDSCSATYTATGTTEHTKTYYTTETYDPLAEIFKFSNDYYLTSINLYFGSKDETEPVKVQIRETSSDNQPTNTVISSQLVYPENITVSDDGSSVTKVTLDQPLYMNANINYALVIGSDSENYTAYIATLGHNDLASNTKINNQPYTNGILYTSSNGSEWSGDQTSDLKFGLNVAKFNPTATAVFKPLTNISLDTFDVFAKYITPNESGLTWSYRMLTKDDTSGTKLTDKPWLPVNTFNLVNVGTIATSIQLKADFTATDYASPKLGIDNLSFVKLTTALTGNYITKNIDLSSSPFNKVSIDYMGYTPYSSSITPYYSTDAGNTWKQVTVQPTITDQMNNWKEYHYKFSVSKAPISENMPNQIKFKVVLSTKYSYLKPYISRFMTVMDQE